MSFQPPPTWALPVLVDEKTQKSIFNPIWLKWFVDLTSVISSIGSGGTAINHNTLTGLQGGGSSQYYHMTSAEYTVFAGTSWAAPGTIGSTTPNTGKFTTLQATISVSSPIVQASAAAGFKSSDGSTGYTGTITTASLVGKTVTIKDGIITNIA